jgi:hypothetical protein
MDSSSTRFLDHTQRRATVGRTPLGRVISLSQKPLPDNTQHTNIHTPGGIRNHDRSRRSVGLLLDEWSARRRDIYLTTHNTQISIPLVGFEITIVVGEWQ